MNSIFAKTIYTGKSIVSDAYLVFNGQTISGISKTTKGKWASFICWRGDPFDLTNYPVAVYGEGNLLYSN
jgi:hypothetical protein